MTSPTEATTDNGSRGVPVIVNVLRIIRCFTVEHPQQGVTEIAEQVGLHKSSVSRILSTLEQERVVERLGGNQLIPLDIRVIAATKEDLRQAADAGRFRADLYYRLNVIELRVPPLRERREDIAQLAEVMLTRLAEGTGLTAFEQGRMQHRDAAVGQRVALSFGCRDTLGGQAEIAAGVVRRIVDQHQVGQPIERFA